MVYPFSINPVKLDMGEYGTYSFRPVGPLYLERINPQAAQSNPVWKKYSVTWSAHLLVGLGIAGKKKSYTTDQLVGNVRKFLKDSGFPQDSSFVSQSGVYTYEKTKKVEKEKSAQVIIINPGEPVKKFFDTMIALAERLCGKMQQETIIIQQQRNGVVQKTLVVSDKPKPENY